MNRADGFAYRMAGAVGTGKAIVAMVVEADDGGYDGPDGGPGDGGDHSPPHGVKEVVEAAEIVAMVIMIVMITPQIHLPYKDFLETGRKGEIPLDNSHLISRFKQLYLLSSNRAIY